MLDFTKRVIYHTADFNDLVQNPGQMRFASNAIFWYVR